MTPLEKQDPRRTVYVDSVGVAMDEIKSVVSLFAPDFVFADIEPVILDTVKLFEGNYPGYRVSLTEYHDLYHTLSVTLATARLMHGCFLDGHTFSPNDVYLALASSLFHDSGLIQKESDTQGTGAKYTVGHEERSVDFAKAYFSRKGLPETDIETCAAVIRCTIMAVSPRSVVFPSKDLFILGQVVGSADLLAQMADRQYLEKLLLLFKEFQEARIPGFDSELDLLQKTSDFYFNIANKRLREELGGVGDNMLRHFKAYCGIDKDMYALSIGNNIRYVEKLQKECGDSYECYLENLKRGGIAMEELKQLHGNTSDD
jgi:hypothetical protein